MAEFIPTAYEAVAGGYRYKAWSSKGAWYVMRGRSEDAWIPTITQCLQTNGWVMTTKRESGKEYLFNSIEELTQYLGVLLLD